MKKRKTLFVMYSGENLPDVFAYTTDLAKSMDTILVVLILFSKTEREKWDAVFMAATFGEANMPDTARSMMQEVTGLIRIDGGNPNQKLVRFIRDFEASGVEIELYTTKMTLQNAMNEIMNRDPDIELVLFSPEVSRSDVYQEGFLKRLLNSLSKPFTTMTRKTEQRFPGRMKPKKAR